VAIVLQNIGHISMKTTGVFRAGTSGLVLAEPNKKAYPAEFHAKSRLNFYASKFNTIEINSSFYKIPRGITYKKWSEDVPDNFQFTVKLWRGITHEKEFSEKDLQSFMAAVDNLGKKKGCLLIQFPAQTNLDIRGLNKLLESVTKLDSGQSWRLAIEFRHAKWYNKNVSGILDSYNASLVLHDMPKSAPPGINEKAPLIYLRFHGEKGDYRGSYEERYLEERAIEIRSWQNQGKDVYVYFNNTIGDAAANLVTLQGLVQN
jgi:uncharacterized protein YecE (DUF72 family)